MATNSPLSRSSRKEIPTSIPDAPADRIEAIPSSHSTYLPVDVLVIVARYLTCLRDKLNLSLINRTCHPELINHLHNYAISCDSAVTGYEFLRQAVTRHDFRIVSKYLSRVPVIEFSQTPRLPLVHIAVHEGRIDLLKTLLSRKDVTENDWMLNSQVAGRIPPLIQLTQMKGMADIIPLLLSHKKVDKNVKWEGSNALWHAVHEGNCEADEALLQDVEVERNGDAERSLRHLYKERNEPLRQAIHVRRNINRRIIELRIKDPRTDLNRRNADGKTVLMMAIDRRDERIVEQIIATRRNVLSYRSDISAAEYAERLWAQERSDPVSKLGNRYTGRQRADLTRGSAYFASVSRGDPNVTRSSNV